MAVPPGRIGAVCVTVHPVKLTVLLTPIAALSKLGMAPGFRVTPAGVPFNPVKVVAVEPSKALLAPPGNTSMYSVTVERAPTRVKKAAVE